MKYGQRVEEGKGNRRYDIAPLSCVFYSFLFQSHFFFLQVGEAVRVALDRSSGKDALGDDAAGAAPEGLEPFFCPELAADGRGPCQCSPEGGNDDRNRFSTGGWAGAPNLGCPSPRLFTFAAPGRNGAGIFYGACLSVFRCVCGVEKRGKGITALVKFIMTPLMLRVCSCCPQTSILLHLPAKLCE